MKKILLCVFFAILFAFMPTVQVFASNSTTFTFADGNPWLFMRTQDAYIVSEILFTDGELNAPEDLFLHDGKLFVADTGNRRVVALNLETHEFTTVAEGVFNRPTGIFISHRNELFVADNGNNTVFRFDLEGNLLQEITRPTDRIFGEQTSFSPQKVLVDRADIIYVISEGTFDGIIQLTDAGDFIGFFGVNNVYLSPLEMLQNLIFSDEQLARLIRRPPLTFTNMALDRRGLLRTVTQHSQMNSVRVHNVAGQDLIGEQNGILGEMNFVDIAVGRYGQMYAVSGTGLIYAYTQEGFYLFTFGGRAISAERNGIFTIATAIEVCDRNILYVLDRGRNNVHVFIPTNFSASIHSAIALHESGYYNEALEMWREIRREGGHLRVVNLFIGRAYYQLRQYEEASYFFRLAFARGFYSSAFWEIRNEWMINNLNRIILAIVAIYIFWTVIKQTNKRKNFLPDLRPLRKRITSKKLVADLLHMKNFIRHPVDSFYYLRADQKGGTAAAAILLATAYVVYMINMLGSGFLFGMLFGFINAYTILYLSAVAVPAVILFIGCNYLVASITDGRGRFKDVFNLVGYSFAPFIIFMPILTIVSHFLTLNESFVISLGSAIIYVWVGVLIFIGLKEIHDFDISVVWKNLFLTIALAFIVVVVLFMIFMFWDSLIDVGYTIFREAGHRAIN